MDLYGNQVSFGKAVVARTPIRVVKVVEIDIPFGCAPCTSGDSPLFDLDQSILFGY